MFFPLTVWVEKMNWEDHRPSWSLFLGALEVVQDLKLASMDVFDKANFYQASPRPCRRVRGAKQQLLPSGRVTSQLQRPLLFSQQHHDTLRGGDVGCDSARSCSCQASSWLPAGPGAGLGTAAVLQHQLSTPRAAQPCPSRAQRWCASSL